MLRQCFAISWDSQLTICSPTACRWPAPTELTVFSYVSSKCRNWACFSCSHSSYIAHQQASTLSYHSQSVFNSNSSMDQFSQISHVILLPTHMHKNVYWRLHGLAPRYLSHYIQRIADSNHCYLRSSSSSQLLIPHTWLSTVGDHAFLVAESHLWNSLPPDVTSAPTLTVFWNHLKTFPDHFLPHCFRFLVLYTVYSGLAVLYLGHSK